MAKPKSASKRVKRLKRSLVKQGTEIKHLNVQKKITTIQNTSK